MLPAMPRVVALCCSTADAMPGRDRRQAFDRAHD
jgi:hypothetical protein